MQKNRRKIHEKSAVYVDKKDNDATMKIEAAERLQETENYLEVKGVIHFKRKGASERHDRAPASSQVETVA